jgi:hypothetical protein
MRAITRLMVRAGHQSDNLRHWMGDCWTYNHARTQAVNQCRDCWGLIWVNTTTQSITGWAALEPCRYGPVKGMDHASR